MLVVLGWLKVGVCGDVIGGGEGGEGYMLVGVID